MSKWIKDRYLAKQIVPTPTHEEIEAQIQAYLADGKKIEQVATGVTGDKFTLKMMDRSRAGKRGAPKKGYAWRRYPKGMKSI